MSDEPRQHSDQQVSDKPGTTSNGVDYAPRMPDAVRRAAARAEELAQQIAAENQLEAAVVGGTPQAPEVPSEPYMAPEAPSAPPQPQPPQDDWQNRYRTLQGKYDHEVPQLTSHIRQLESLIATMQAPARAEPPANPMPQPPQNLISDDDLTTYGEDFVESTRRWARAEVQEDLQRMRQELDELRGFANQSTGDRLKDRVRAALNRDPEIGGVWEQLDTHPGFNAWLQDFDPFSGQRRLDLLRDAYAGGDAVRTGRFFKAYLHEHTDNTRMPEVQPAQTAAPVTPRNTNGGYYGNGAGQVDLAAYAAPGRAPNATPGPGAPERRIWTNRDIQAFYEGRLKGRFRGREQEADRLERDILAAAQEGRVTQ